MSGGLACYKMQPGSLVRITMANDAHGVWCILALLCLPAVSLAAEAGKKGRVKA
jgi:hypothetical protein